MNYYMLLPGESFKYIEYDDRLIGYTFKTDYSIFHIGDGFTLLQNLIINDYDKINDIRIFDDTNKIYSVDELLEFIKQHKKVIYYD